MQRIKPARSRKLAHSTTLSRQLCAGYAEITDFTESANPAPSTSNALLVGDAAFRRKPDKFGASHGDLHRHSSRFVRHCCEERHAVHLARTGARRRGGRSAHGRERGKPTVSRVNAIILLTARRIIAYDDCNHPVLCRGLFIGSGYVW